MNDTEAREWVDRFRDVRPNADMMHVAFWALDELERRGWDDDALADIRRRIMEERPPGTPAV